MRSIEIDYNQVKGAHNKYASYCVGAGRAAEALRMDFQNHLETAAKECGFRYLRFHGIFHDDMGVYTVDKEGREAYNWQYVDSVYDAILDRGVKPFVEISFMPADLAGSDKTVFWWKANVTPPKDYERWYALVNHFVLHLEERYGREEVATWYFEVWNEPNHPAFYSSTMEEYFKMYAITCSAIKAVSGSYRVGGPATAGNAWVSELIEYCCSNQVPLDFISTHMYGVRGDFDEYGDAVLYLIEDPDYVINAVGEIYKAVKASSMPDLEIHYTEWSSSFSSRDPVHDSYIQAPYILYHLKRMEGLVHSLSYWTFTDVFEEVGPPPSPFHGGFGLMNLQGLKKPAFFAYRFLAGLGATELENNDSDSWVCKNEEGIQALVWNYTQQQQDVNNQVYFKRDLVSEKRVPAVLKITGLPEGKYRFRVYSTGYSRNDVYTDYLKMGAPGTLKRLEVRRLAEDNQGLPVAAGETAMGSGEAFRLELDMRENDVVFVKIETQVSISEL